MRNLWKILCNDPLPSNRQKEFGKKALTKVTEASGKVTKKLPKESRKRRSDQTPFADLLLRHPNSPQNLCDFWVRWKRIAILFAICRGKQSPCCRLAGNWDVCDRKSRRFAIAIFGALSSLSWWRKIHPKKSTPNEKVHLNGFVGLYLGHI